MRRRLIILLPFALAGCLREPDPFEYVEPALSVHALLRASDTEVRVSVLPGVGEIGAAELRLDDGTRTIQLSPAANDSAKRGIARLFTARMVMLVKTDIRISAL